MFTKLNQEGAIDKIKLIANGVAADLTLLHEHDLAILVEGKASNAWIPKIAIDDHGHIAPWFIPSPHHRKLFTPP